MLLFNQLKFTQMKKLFVVSFLALVANASFGQSFTFKKCFVEAQGLQPTMIKINGEVHLSDSTIQMVQNGQTSIQPITYLSNSDVQKQFIFKSESSDIRYTLTPNKDVYLLSIEAKDKFTNSISRMMYWLSKKE